jgi:hypothetical protein
LEAILLRMVHQHPSEAHAAVGSLEPRTRPRRPDPNRWSLAELLAVAAAVGWLPPIDIGEALIDVEAFAAFGRELRNRLHPGRHLELSSDWSLEEAEAADAQTLLLIVDWLLKNVEPQVRDTGGSG